MVGRLTNMMYSENSIKKIEDALDNLIQEDNYFLEDCYHHENHFEKRFHFETGAVVSYVGYYLYSEQKKISCDNWLNESIKKIVDEFPSVGFPIDDISITSVLLNFLDSSKNVNCVHICSDGCIYVKTETNENKGEKGISIEDFIHEYLVFDSIEEKEQKKQKIQSVFDYHISILKHIETQDISSINPKSSLYREILKKRKINKYFSFFPFYYYGSCYKRVFFVLTILQSDYLYPEFDDEGECVVESHPPIIESDKVLKIQLYLQSALWQLLQDRLSYEKRKSVSESLKSAVSAIMTRNMSHNLGSHYLHYTKTQLEQLAKKGGEFGPDIRGAAKVMEYMQGRMDYLATLVSGDCFPYGCVNFKSQIYDVLTVDDFSKRHFGKSKKNSNEQLYPIIEILEEIQKGNNSKQILKEKLQELYRTSSEALKNDSYNRTTNFLLTNLILSENFTRPNILKDSIEEGKGLNKINLQVLFNDKIFTGLSDTEVVKRENCIKRDLSKINIAMPGGVMSCHAFFNILENFIRNSAKYLQSDFSENNDLTITIKIVERIGENAEKIGTKGEKLDVYEFTIFDNKHNACRILPDENIKLIESLQEKLKKLCILDDTSNAVEKKNKGIKEMLFSAIWLRSYMYQNATSENTPNSYEDVLLQIQSSKTEDPKLDLINKYGFSFLAVDDNGVENSTNASNLGLRFTLPQFNTKTKLILSNNTDVNTSLSNLLHIYGDVTCVDDKYTEFVKNLNKERSNAGKDTYEEDMIIPRMLKNGDGLTEIEALKNVLHTRFGEDFDKYQISFGSSDDNLTSELENQYNIYFERHLSTKCDSMEDYKNYAYADSVSGGNYTITLSDIYIRWAKNGREIDSDYYEILKIKESALTRITLIDERLYNKMKNQKTGTELACKNIRILNYNESNFSEDKIDNFIKLFTDDHKFNNGKDETHFLSIHLGIIEKIVKNADMFTLMKDEKGESISVDGRVKVFMRLLKEKFGPKVFISVHSGRGNFSAELEQSLDMYPFISMAALENVYENSKYLLSQLFYSTIYIGKGVANQHN